MFKSILILLVLFSFSSCREDFDQTDDISLQYIIDTWNTTDVEYETFVAGIKVASGTGLVSGTITFFEDGTGEQNYTVTIQGNTRVRDQDFVWERNGPNVVFNKGTAAESNWEWLVNEENKQVATFEYVVSPSVSDVVITLTK